MKQALLVVDIQNDFLPGGALAVPKGDAILPFVIDLMQNEQHYNLIVLTQDWHPKEHGSFASSHPGKAPFQFGELSGLPQMLWPDHCVEGTNGARIAAEIEEVSREIVARGRHIINIKKGQDPDIDSYSAFYDNARLHETGLQNILRELSITDLDIVGLTLDYCVRTTALDAVFLGFKTRVFLKGTRAVDPSAEPQVISELSAAGVDCVAGK